MRTNPADTTGSPGNLPADHESQIDVEATAAAVVEWLRPRGWLSTGTVTTRRDAERAAINAATENKNKETP